MEFEERFASLANDVDSFVKDGKIYVELEYLEILNSLMAQMALRSLHLWSHGEQALLAMMLDYYGGFNKMVLKKHAGEIVPNSPEDLE